MAETVRLDVWLDVACLFKTRSEAQRACKVGRVSVNGAVAKPHRDLRVGDELVIDRPGGGRQIVVVHALAERPIAKADARKLFDGDPSIAAGTFNLDVHRFSVFYPGLVGTPPK